MTTQERKIFLLHRNVRQCDLANKFHVSPGMISGLLNGHFKSNRLQRKIAILLRTKVSTFWGEEAQTSRKQPLSAPSSTNIQHTSILTEVMEKEYDKS